MKILLIFVCIHVFILILALSGTISLLTQIYLTCIFIIINYLLVEINDRN